jgi:hypothetical protein
VVNFTPRPLYPRERKPVPTKLEAVWAPDLVWTFYRREKYLATTGIRTPDPPITTAASEVTSKLTIFKLKNKLPFFEVAFRTF